MRMLKNIAVSLVLIGIGYGAMLYFFGTTTVVAQNDDGVSAQVVINGERRGETPFKVRLGPGIFNINIEPPEGYRSVETSSFTMVTAGLGHEARFKLASIDYRATFVMKNGTAAYFEVLDKAGKVVGDCEGKECSVQLPGPGKYRVLMEENCEKEPCSKGKDTFDITDEQSETTIGWN